MKCIICQEKLDEAEVVHWVEKQHSDPDCLYCFACIDEMEKANEQLMGYL